MGSILTKEKMKEIHKNPDKYYPEYKKFRNIYKPTSDDWYGNYETTDGIKLVQIIYSSISDGHYRVSAWGTDDYALTIESLNEIEMNEMFLKVLDMKEVNKKTLIALGFVPF